MAQVFVEQESKKKQPLERDQLFNFQADAVSSKRLHRRCFSREWRKVYNKLKGFYSTDFVSINTQTSMRTQQEWVWVHLNVIKQIIYKH